MQIMDTETGAFEIRNVRGLGPVTAEMLRDTFPQWHIFSQLGAWWATREGSQKFTGPQSLIRRVLVADSLAALGDKLCLQEWLDGLDPLALDQVWREMTMRSDAP
jgi:hypothetical protein